jgi:asparagine synthase (glutamine-hydrolysing)
MSVQFGRINFDGKPVDPKELDRVRPVLAPYGPDGEGRICKDNFGVLHRAFHTTKESRLEHQPHVLPSSVVITWDGRLDNREDLIRQLEGRVSTNSTDLAIVAGAFERWGTNTFANLIGDWAISIWDPGSRSLILAKDFAGTRHLYYSIERNGVSWCTILDPIVHFAERSFTIEEEYFAGWLSFFPAPHLTPYKGIHSVPPSTFVRIQRATHTIQKYWNVDPLKRIRYKADAEYEAHFRSVLSTAVSRRLRSDSPVLAELSGGMDSSSIVCIGDSIIATGASETPRLDTVSYYDDSEPHWNERPYFAKVEERRGRKGCHIPVDSASYLRFDFPADVFLTTPGLVGRSGVANAQFSECTKQQGSRVLLSGIGGDEVTGGVPTPLPELEDLLASAQLNTLARQLKAWSLNKRVPWFHLLFEAVRAFLPPALCGVPAHRQPAPWIEPSFAARNRVSLQGYESRLLLFGPAPSFQENMWALESLRRQLSYDPLVFEPLYEKRYPYLDRDLVEFMYSIPREQLVRPGQRRSLMRRALVDIVPDEIRSRKRKAYVSRGPMFQIAADLNKFLEFGHDMMLASLGVVDSLRFSNALRAAAEGQQTPMVLLLRTLVLEAWIRHAKAWNAFHTAKCGHVDRRLRDLSTRKTGRPSCK